MRQDEEFAPLRIVRKNVTDFDRCAYRVYKSSAEYITVEAATALEAYRESGIKDPLRIVRETRFMERLLDQARFSEIEDIIETGVIMQAPQAITGHREAVPQVAPKPQAEAQAQFQPGIPSQAEENPEEDIAVDEEIEAAAPSAEPAISNDQPAQEVQPKQAAPTATEEADESSELSEEQIHALLGSEEQERAQAATAGDEGLSPDDVARLLEQGEKK